MSTQRPPWVTVAKREMVVKVTEKSFIISTVVTMVAILGAIFLSTWVSGPSTVKVAVTEQVGTQAVEVLDESSDDIWEAIVVADAPAAQDAVAAGDVDAALFPSSGGYTYLVKEASSDTLVKLSEVQGVVSQIVIADNAASAGVQLDELTAGSVVTSESLDDNEQGVGAAFFTGLIFSVLFFATALMFGLQIAGSVVKEKESRVVEILSAAVPTTHLLVGKVIGASILALGQVVLLIGVGAAGAHWAGLDSAIPNLWAGIGWFIVFFLAGFVALSCLWAAAGAIATTYEDLNQTSLPLNMILMFGYVAGFVAQGPLHVVLSYVPILSSIMMPQRLVLGSATWWEALIALGITVAFTALAIRVGSAMYRRGIMQTSGTMSWRQALADSRK